MAADQPMHDVPELVKERAHFVVRHETWIVGTSTRQTGDEHGLGNVLAGRALLNRAEKGAAPLVRAWVEVQVHATNQALVLQHLVHTNGRMPDVDAGDRPIADREDPGRHVEDALEYAVEREVWACGLRIEVVALFPDLF